MLMHTKRLLVLKNTLIHSVNLFYTLTIGVLSLVHLTDVPKLNTGFDDKIVHFILYAGLCLTWFLSLHILKNKSENDNQSIELLDDISKDLFNYDLEFRIQELESRFSKDMSETIFNELKELKNERKIN